MKRFLPIALSLIVMLVSLGAPLKVQASDYSIPGAEFTVTINEDGSVDVVEVWTVRFEEGSFTRFYKDIVTNADKEDSVKLVQGSVYARIDGRDCVITDDSAGRPADHYHLEANGNGTEISWYKPSQNVTRTYEVGYRLTNAVKYVDNSYYLFTYRLIGANFSKHVDSIKVTINTPEGTANDLRYATKADNATITNGHVINITASGNSGMYKVKLRMEGTAFSDTVPLSGKDLNNSNREKKLHLKDILGILAFVGRGCSYTYYIHNYFYCRISFTVCRTCGYCDHEKFLQKDAYQETGQK